MAIGTATAIMGGASLLGSIGGNIIGNMASGDDRKRAEAAMRKAMAEWDALGQPPDLSGPMIMKHFEQAGILTPEMEQTINQEVSKVSQIQEAPELREAQLKALSDIQQVGKTGLRPEDRAALAQVRQQAQRDSEAKRQQILQNLQARGLAGSGSELASQLAASQQAAETQEMAGLGIAGQASQRALEAIGKAGGLAGQIRGQEFDIERTKKGAEDELARFNIQAQREQQARNIGSKNIAQQQNIASKQRAMDLNTQQYNLEQQRQKDAQRQYFQDKMALAKAKTGAYTDQAKSAQDEASRKQQSWASIGSGVGQLGGKLAGGLTKGDDTPQFRESTPEDELIAKRKGGSL